MPISITQNNNTVKITQDNPVITVTDNNKGTSVDVTQVDITTVSVATPGPKGDKGDNALTAADDLAIQDLTVRHITASNNISASETGSFGKLETTGNATVGGDLFVPQYIKHLGDEDTFINFTDNQIRFKAGNIGFFDMEKDASVPYPATINPGGNRINFRVVDRNTDLLLKTDSELYKVNLYYAGNQKLETAAGGINITGHITSSGTISASGDLLTSGITRAASHRFIDNNVYIADGGSDLDIVGGGLNADGNITASGEISSSSKIYATQFQAESSFRLNDSGGTHRHVLRSAVTGNEIELGNSNFSGIEITGHVSASGDVTASGNIYSANFDSIPLSFQASGDGANWYGPNKQGPYYYVYNFNYGDNTAVTSLAREYVAAGVIMPYKCELVGFQAVVSNIASEDAVRIALYQGVGSASTFNVTSGAADALTLEVLAVETSLIPGAAENPMKITKLNVNKQLAQGDLIYPRIICGSSGANVSMHILIRRRP